MVWLEPASINATERLSIVHALDAQGLLGEALATIILSYAAKDGFDDEAYGLPIKDVSLSVGSPQTVNYSAELWLDNGDEDWTLAYHRNHPALDGAPKTIRSRSPSA